MTILLGIVWGADQTLTVITLNEDFSTGKSTQSTVLPGEAKQRFEVFYILFSDTISKLASLNFFVNTFRDRSEPIPVVQRKPSSV